MQWNPLLLFAAQWLYLHKTTQAKSWGLEETGIESLGTITVLSLATTTFLLLKIKQRLKYVRFKRFSIFENQVSFDFKGFLIKSELLEVVLISLLLPLRIRWMFVKKNIRHGYAYFCERRAILCLHPIPVWSLMGWDFRSSSDHYHYFAVQIS
jgi:hypothetical protein